ncbi:Mitochondrial and cytoplasmic arginine-tRNA ligase Rrs1/Mrs1 [Taphrina deformans PYCC 5710]|uniref:arginine--tRNA ligase n=1 Tax=Taphrina deformans (strain PYCC 5710 / ATCC 11124 / CBS 356.35 / IMI 108563 / JCM 9778 / NBRC 8474) TaxID=1097556 RepID=R4X7M2_TAPDE|nr:Mitochondrial and cytoplasmic arginine-tRNA ligase Rrs1/Mrs1 [Taphrina deformans PYCC 5710]|eukprot:CCG81405.1 Mitochondrial and cytoplasmic arginine-tRNA ligase Rrs1/Mrs1 [Taphrina deformans PYCC 5710]
MSDLASQFAKLGVKESVTLPANADPEHNPLDVFKSYISAHLAPIANVDANTIFAALDLPLPKGQGDLVLPLPRLGKLKGKPADLANQWASEFPSDFVTAKSSNIFLQFTFPDQKLNQFLIPNILQQGKKYGTFSTYKGKKVIVEFSSPNIAKPFHAGHLRSTIIGSFLSNVHEAMGWDVIRMNYLGDWGKQYGLLALGYEAFGNEEALEKDAIAHLYEVYVKINQQATEQEDAEKKRKETCETDGTTYEPAETLHDKARAYFKAMENGSEQELSVWRKFRDLSIVKLEQTYARLNIRYDIYSGESQVPQQKMNEAMDVLRGKGLIVEDKGAQLIDLTPHNKKLGKAIVQKRDGTTLYLTRDIGEAADRFEKHKFDKMIYVVAAQQDLHLAQLFKILSLMDYEWADRCTHVNFGMVKGMSTRKGTAVFLDQILEEAKVTMHQVMQKNEEKYKQIEDPESVSDTVGISSVMIQDMSAKRINDYEFSWDRMTSFEGDTGPYMQYAHSRLSSMQRKAGLSDADLTSADLSLLTEQAATDMVKLLAIWPAVVQQTFKAQEPSTIVTYLYRLCHAFSGAYDKLWVHGQEAEVARARMALYVSCRIVLSNGMRLLGLCPLDRM